MVTVITWQPIASAWKTFSSSRGLAQISSGIRIRAENAHRLGCAARDRGRCRRCGLRTPRRSRRARRRGGADALDLLDRHERRHVDSHAGGRQPAQQVFGRLAAALVTGIFTKTLSAPGRDLQRLLFHLVQVVGEDLERDRADRARARAARARTPVVGDAGLAHERRIRREAGDQRVAAHLEDRCPVGTVREELHAQIRERLHEGCSPRARVKIQSAASTSDSAT